VPEPEYYATVSLKQMTAKARFVQLILVQIFISISNITYI